MRSLILGTAGHIDHGKSALVMALTGTDPDRLKEEKARGITIELGFAHTVVGDVDVSFVDVPGHERFVRTMLAGAGGIDAVLLVVAADESVMPQTREHLAICRMLGVERGIVALTKSDLVDAETCAVTALEVSALVEGTFLASAPIVPVSARTGAGLDALRQAILALPAGSSRQGRPRVARLPVDRSFTIRGFGTVATGTLVSGRIGKGDELEVLPGGRRVRVRGVQVHGRDAPEAEAPRRTAVNLAGVEVDALGRGVTLATPGAFVPTRRADARIQMTGSRDRSDPSAAAPALRHGSRVRVYNGTCDIAARVSIAAVREPGGAWQRAGANQSFVAVPHGGEAFVRLRLAAPAVLTRLDRLVLRAHSPAVTVAGGLVLDPEPPDGGLRRASTLDRFQQLDAEPGAAGGDADRLATAFGVWIREAGDRGLGLDDLVRRAGVADEVAKRATTVLEQEGRAQIMDGRVFDADAARRLLAAVAAARAAQQPPAAAPEDDPLRAQVEAVVRQGRLTPPEADAIATEVRLPRPVVDRLIVELVRDGRFVRVGPLAFHREALATLKAEVKALAAAAPGAKVQVDVAGFKTRYGISRKFAIPLLEWLDRERVTRRVGEARIVI
jgi:selenocysteine-specific elongation factor